MSTANGYHLQPEEEYYICQAFEAEFQAFRSFITQPTLGEEQLSYARYFLGRITEYHDRLSTHLSESLVDSLMFSAYMRVLDKEQAARKKPKGRKL